MITNIPTLAELEAEHPILVHLTRDELARYIYILARLQAIDEFSGVLERLTRNDAEKVLQ